MTLMTFKLGTDRVSVNPHAKHLHGYS